MTENVSGEFDISGELKEIRRTNASIDRGINLLLDRIVIAEGIVADQKKTHRRLKWAVVTALIGVLLDVTLTVIIFNQQGQINHANRDLAAVQETTSGKVLCPLYKLLNDSLNQDLDRNGVITTAERTQWNLQSKDTNRDGKITADEEDRFRVTALAIRNGYDALACTT